MPEATARISAFTQTTVRIQKYLPRTYPRITYDVFLNSVLDFFEVNQIPVNVVLGKKKIIWIEKEIKDEFVSAYLNIEKSAK